MEFEERGSEQESSDEQSLLDDKENSTGFEYEIIEENVDNSTKANHSMSSNSSDEMLYVIQDNNNSVIGSDGIDENIADVDEIIKESYPDQFSSNGVQPRKDNEFNPVERNEKDVCVVHSEEA